MSSNYKFDENSKSRQMKTMSNPKSILIYLGKSFLSVTIGIFAVFLILFILELISTGDITSFRYIFYGIIFFLPVFVLKLILDGVLVFTYYTLFKFSIFFAFITSVGLLYLIAFSTPFNTSDVNITFFSLIPAKIIDYFILKNKPLE
jgi:hypothetical protein